MPDAHKLHEQTPGFVDGDEIERCLEISFYS